MGPLRIISILICLLIIPTSGILGQSSFDNDDAILSYAKGKDNPFLKLSEDKKHWLPIPSPKFSNSSRKSAILNPLATIEYDVISGTTNHAIYNDSILPSVLSQNRQPSSDRNDQQEAISAVFSPDGRIKISPTVDFPWRTICKLYIIFPSGDQFVGTGVLIGRDDGIGFHCLTVAHNVYRQEFGGMAKSVEIIPGLDNDYTPFYSAWAVKIRVPEAWTQTSLPEYDWALVTLDRQLANFTGWMTRFTTSDLNWYKRVFYCAGYPVDLDFGLCLYFDSDSASSVDENFLWHKMDAFDGQDGMPIWVMDGNTRKIVSLHIGEDNNSKMNMAVRFNNNNIAQLEQWLKQDLPPTDLPDLIDDGAKWSDFQGTTVVRGFTRFRIWNDVRNIGTNRSGGFTIAYYASVDAEIDPNSDYLIGTTQIPSIPPFSWRHAIWQGIFPEPIPAGEYYIGWIIDPNNEIIEFNEKNNFAFIASKKLQVRDPYIELANPGPGEVYVIGETNTIQWFTAGGSGLITIDISYDNGSSWQNLVTNLPDSGFYQWNIPASVKPSFQCLLRITDTFKNLSDASDSVFIVETRPTAPGVPKDLGRFTNKAAVPFTWSEANDPESGIVGYRIQVGTSPGAKDIADTTVADLSFVANGGHNQTLYARVCATNGVGLCGPWSGVSDGILIDLTPPILQGGPFDEGEFTGKDSVLFRWNPAIDEESGVIMNYKLQVGTAIGRSDVFDKWITRKLEYKVAGKHGQTLYARIRVHNAAIGVSDWSDWSDGITIDLTPPSAPGKPSSEATAVNYFDVPFSWDPASDDLSGIASYRLRVIDLNADSAVVFDQWIGESPTAIVPANDGQALLASVQAKNKAGLVGPWATASRPVAVQLTPALLTFIEGSPAFEGEGWDNAIDNDIEDWDGTVTAFTSSQRAPYAIFGFLGGGFSKIEKIKLLTDTKVGFKNRWVTHFRILYSITGTQEADFLPLVTGQKLIGGWEEFSFPAQTVKFIKLIVDQPTAASTAYCQLGELQVFGRADFVKSDRAELVVTYGTPTDPAESWSNAIDGDISDWDGTVTAMTLDPPAHVIFSFADQSIKNISKIRILTDTGVRFSFRWLKAFHLEVSTSGIKPGDFSKVFSATKTTGDWESFYFDPVPAKYIKLVLDRPDPSQSDYCQIGEVEIYTQQEGNSLPNNFVQLPMQSAQPAPLAQIPNNYQVEQNYPNPFNPETSIRFQLPQESRVILAIYNMMGQEIIRLVDGTVSAGVHEVRWDGRDSQGIKVPSGMYLYQFRAGEFNATKKMILLE